jgi:large subunit ribosomal protein L25
MQRVAIEAVARESGKHGKLSALRRQGFIPAIVYGHGMAPLSVAVQIRAFERIRRTTGKSAIVELQFEGGKTMTTVVHEFQIDSIRDTYIHIDFLSISLDEPLTSRIPIRPVGTPIGLKEGGVLEHSLYELEVEALPLDIPDYLDVDVSELGLKHSIHVADLQLGDKVKVLTNETATVFSVVAPVIEEAPPVPEEGVVAEGTTPAAGAVAPAAGTPAPAAGTPAPAQASAKPVSKK